MTMDTVMNTDSVRMTTPSGGHPLLPQGQVWTDPPFTFGFVTSDPRWYGMYQNVSKSDSSANSAWDASFVGRCDGVHACAAGGQKPELKIWHPANAASSGVESELVFPQSP